MLMFAISAEMSWKYLNSILRLISAASVDSQVLPSLPQFSGDPSQQSIIKFFKILPHTVEGTSGDQGIIAR